MKVDLEVPNTLILLVIGIASILLLKDKILSLLSHGDQGKKLVKDKRIIKHSKKMVKKQIIVVGAGLIGPRHAHHVSINPRCELFAIVDLFPVPELVEKYNTRYFQNIKDLIGYCDSNGLKYPDGAIVCTPNHTHAKVSKELSDYGINLIIEKPVTPTPEDSKALKLYTMNKVKVLVGHHRRFHPVIKEAKAKIKQIGDVLAIQGSWCLKKHHEYYNDWRKSRSGGPMLINLVHDLDLLQYLLGPVQSVFAEPLKNLRDHDDEGCSLVLKFKSGTIGTFVVSDNIPSPFNFENATGENPLIPHCPIDGLYRIFGNKGTLSLPDMKIYSTEHWHKPMVVEELNRPVGVPFDDQLNHFVDVLNGDLIKCTIDDGISAVLVTQAIMESLDTGERVIVKDLSVVEPNFNVLGLKELTPEPLKPMATAIKVN